MKYFAASFFDNSVTAQNHGVWAVEKNISGMNMLFYGSCKLVLNTFIQDFPCSVLTASGSGGVCYLTQHIKYDMLSLWDMRMKAYSARVVAMDDLDRLKTVIRRFGFCRKLPAHWIKSCLLHCVELFYDSVF